MVQDWKTAPAPQQHCLQWQLLYEVSCVGCIQPLLDFLLSTKVSIYCIVVWRYFKIHKAYNINFETSSPSPASWVKENKKKLFWIIKYC